MKQRGVGTAGWYLQQTTDKERKSNTTRTHISTDR